VSAAAAAPSSEERVRASVLGMILFIASETMFFGGLFAALFTLRAQAPAWPPPGTPAIDLALPLVLTGVLLASSATQHLALEAGRAGDVRGVGRWLGCTVALGLLFLLGEGYEWAAFFNEGFTVSTNVFGTLFFTITGFHGLHLAAGLAILLLAGARARRAAARGRRVAALESATLYWHFVDGVWVLVVTSLYVLTALA
jgi:cytochrome c oxidase subunit 3